MITSPVKSTTVSLSLSLFWEILGTKCNEWVRTPTLQQLAVPKNLRINHCTECHIKLYNLTQRILCGISRKLHKTCKAYSSPQGQKHLQDKLQFKGKKLTSFISLFNASYYLSQSLAIQSKQATLLTQLLLHYQPVL